MAHATVSVEVDLGDIDTEDLLAELREREEAEGASELQAMFRALSFGNEQEALSILRTYLCDKLGRVLP